MNQKVKDNKNKNKNTTAQVIPWSLADGRRQKRKLVVNREGSSESQVGF